MKQIPSTWNSSAYWEFEMPQISFRAPSASALDRSQDDPAVSDFTPKVTFKWKRDGKFTKDLSCFLAGKTTEGRRNKEPDIPVAMFKGGKDLTVYQPNMHRVEVEDFKGLEVVLLLSAAVIKDIFVTTPTREMFNISSPNTTPGAQSRKRINSGPVIREHGRPSISISPIMSGGIHQSLPPRPISTGPSPPSTVNPRTQWEIDAETARLKALVEGEERERQRLELEEERRIKRMLEQEEMEQRRRDAEIARETERLRRQYGVMPINGGGQRVSFAPQQVPQRPWMSAPVPAPRPISVGPPSHYLMSNGWAYGGGASSSSPQQRPQQGNSPYLQAPGSGTASSSGFFGSKKMQKKRSVFF